MLITSDAREAERQALLSTKRVCGQRALGRVHEQQHAVHQAQRALDLAAEVGVAGRVDDVDLRARGSVTAVFLAMMVMPFSRSRSFESITRSMTLVRAEDARLAEHEVDEGGLAVVDVGHDGHVPNLLTIDHGERGARYFFSSRNVKGRAL